MAKKNITVQCELLANRSLCFGRTRMPNKQTNRRNGCARDDYNETPSDVSVCVLARPNKPTLTRFHFGSFIIHWIDSTAFIVSGFFDSVWRRNESLMFLYFLLLSFVGLCLRACVVCLHHHHRDHLSSLSLPSPSPSPTFITLDCSFRVRREKSVLRQFCVLIYQTVGIYIIYLIYSAAAASVAASLFVTKYRVILMPRDELLPGRQTQSNRQMMIMKRKNYNHNEKWEREKVVANQQRCDRPSSA